MNRNVIITGASGNLGRATVEKFVSEGYSVIATVSPGKSLGFDVTAAVETMEVELTDEMLVEATVRKIISKYKTIDAALLLVGGFAMGDISTTDSGSLRKMYSLNFETAYFFARPVFSQMVKQSTGGRIVFIGARPALLAKDGRKMLAYGLSKSLIFKLSEYLNAEGAGKNVVSSVVVPSTIDTPANRKSMPDADFSSWVTPEAIAEVMEFITSNRAVPLRDSVYKVYGDA